MREKNKHIQKIIDICGSGSNVSKSSGLSRMLINDLLNCRRKVPANKVKLLVSLSKGTVTEKDLRPDIF